ncbi:hypothetical protein GGG16DRAFT_119316 [Schizophyllum commune]
MDWGDWETFLKSSGAVPRPFPLPLAPSTSKPVEAYGLAAVTHSDRLKPSTRKQTDAFWAAAQAMGSAGGGVHDRSCTSSRLGDLDSSDNTLLSNYLTPRKPNASTENPFTMPLTPLARNSRPAKCCRYKCDATTGYTALPVDFAQPQTAGGLRGYPRVHPCEAQTAGGMRGPPRTRYANLRSGGATGRFHDALWDTLDLPGQVLGVIESGETLSGGRGEGRMDHGTRGQVGRRRRREGSDGASPAQVSEDALLDEGNTPLHRVPNLCVPTVMLAAPTIM